MSQIKEEYANTIYDEDEIQCLTAEVNGIEYKNNKIRMLKNN